MTAQATKLGRDILISGAAQALKSLRNLLMLPLLTKALAVAEYGQWGLVMAGVALAVPWISAQLPGALVRFLPGIESREDLREHFYGLFFAVLGGATLSTLAVWWVAPLWADHPSLAPYLGLAGPAYLLLPATALLNTTVAYFRARRQMVRHALLTLGQHFGEIALVAYALTSGGSLRQALTAVLLIRIAILLVSMGLIAGQIGLAWPRFCHLRSNLSFSLPLVPGAVFYRLFDAADRYILRIFFGDAAVGLYEAVYTAGSFFGSLLAPVNLVLLPLAAQLRRVGAHQELGAYITHAMRYSFMLLIPALAGAVVLRQPLLLLLSSSVYLGVVDFFPIMAFSFGVFGIGILAENTIVAAGKTRLIAVATAVMALSNLLLNLILVPRWGIGGAVLATLVCHGGYTAMALVASQRLVPYSIPWRAGLHFAAAAAAMALLVRWLSTAYTPPLELLICCGALAYGLLLWGTGGLTRRDADFLRRVLRGA